MITAKSYFSGAGGMDLGLTEAGIDVVEHFEIDKKCCDTLRKNLKGKVNECDVSKITVLDQRDEEIQGCHGSTDETAGILCTCRMPSECKHVAAAGKETPYPYWQQKALQ